jgi:hypothetical protein
MKKRGAKHAVRAHLNLAAVLEISPVLLPLLRYLRSLRRWRGPPGRASVAISVHHPPQKQVVMAPTNVATGGGNCNELLWMI